MNHLGLIINKKAKNFACLSSYLSALQENAIPFQLYEIEPPDLDSLIQKLQKKHSLLLIGGGDGTIRSAAQHCVNTPTVLGVMPLGTMNHFAKELLLPLTPNDLIEAIKANYTIQTDVGEVNGNIFINNSTIGFYPRFAKKRDYYTKLYNKWLSYIPGFIEALRRHETFAIHMKSTTIDLHLKTSFLMISNNLYSYEFPLTITRESFTKSQLGIYCFKHGKIELLKILRYFFKRQDSFTIRSTSTPVIINIERRNKVLISLDGDTKETPTPLKYQTLPKALNLLGKCP